MCSNNSSCNTQEDLMPDDEKIEVNPDKLCPRCNTDKGEVVLRSKDIYCKSCLLQYLSHKFRAALGKSKLMRPQDKALVAFSASHSSMALLHLLRSATQLSSHKRILFSVCAVYIDDGSISKVSVPERRRINVEVMSSMQAFGFDSYFTCIEEAIDVSSVKLYTDVNELPIEQHAEDGEISKLFDSITTLSSKQYLFQTLRQKLLLAIAKQLKCTKIFTAETQTDLATKIIANLALGKGAHIPLDVGFNDDRVADIITLRPLRDFSSKEVIYYNMFNNLTTVHVPSLATLADPVGSLQKAAESFVTDLQANFPSTVSTVFRTADKLSLDLTNLNIANVCVLCKAPLDTRSDLASSSLGATKFSSHVSNATREELSHVTIKSDLDHVPESQQLVNNVPESQQLVNHVPESQQLVNHIPESQQLVNNFPESQQLVNTVPESQSCENKREECSSLQDTLCYACQYVVKDMDTLCYACQYVVKDMVRTIRGFVFLQDTLCYACQYVVKDMKHDREVGEEVLKKSLREICQSSIEEEIKEFIL